MNEIIPLSLREWKTYGPEDCPQLRGLFLGNDPHSRTLVQRLRDGGMLEVLELRDGLSIRTTSFVGHLSLGSLRLRVLPKLDGKSLLRLLRYAYGLRDLRLFDVLDQDLSEMPMSDLLLHQLAAEVEELLARGLHRHYRRRQEDLDNLRGKIDIQRIATRSAPFSDTIPCIHHPRLEDTPHNQILLAGLRLGIMMTEDLLLRVRLRRMAKLFSDAVSSVKLMGNVFSTIHRLANRQTAAYDSAITLVEALWRHEGIAWEDGDHSVPLPGFLFDMNRFWQALLSRFLHEYLEDHEVLDEERLREMIEYRPGLNPYKRRLPTPRPDFVIRKEGRAVAILDAKYRDLDAERLPRDMLYQLAIYALAEPKTRRSTILYPSVTEKPQETHLVVREPFGAHRELGEVFLRPVAVKTLDQLLLSKQGRNPRPVKGFAEWMVYGNNY